MSIASQASVSPGLGSKAGYQLMFNSQLRRGDPLSLARKGVAKARYTPIAS
jgi:hypothetical protein